MQTITSGNNVIVVMDTAAPEATASVQFQVINSLAGKPMTVWLPGVCVVIALGLAVFM